MQHCDSLTVLQRRSLVSRRNTAKLRLRQKYEREFQTLISIDLNAIQQQLLQRQKTVYPHKTLIVPVKKAKSRTPGLLSWEDAKKKMRKISESSSKESETSTTRE